MVDFVSTLNTCIVTLYKVVTFRRNRRDVLLFPHVFLLIGVCPAKVIATLTNHTALSLLELGLLLLRLLKLGRVESEVCSFIEFF